MFMVNKVITLLMFFSVLFLEASCQNKSEQEARQTIETFIKAWQQQDVALMEELYPGIKQMDFFYSSDKADIVEVTREGNGQLRVRINSIFVTQTKQEVQRRIVFIVVPDNNRLGLYHIRDSYGLACWERYPYYKFALHTGCIPSSEMASDVELSSRMNRAKQMVFVYSQALYDRLSEDVHIVENTMTRNDGRHSEGVALVQNDSQFHLPGLQYSIIFYNETHQEMGRHQGWVTHDIFPAGEACAFNYEADIVQGASLMYFVLDFDVEMIVDYVLSYSEYTGREYNDFQNRVNKGNTTSVREVLLSQE